MTAISPEWLRGCTLRSVYFEPTFHKHKGLLCGGIQVHVDHKGYEHKAFKPYRLVAVALRAIQEIYPQLALWRNPPYEYEERLMPIDILSGDSYLREWVGDSSKSVAEFEKYLVTDESQWLHRRAEHLLY